MLLLRVVLQLDVLVRYRVRRRRSRLLRMVDVQPMRIGEGVEGQPLLMLGQSLNGDRLSLLRPLVEASDRLVLVADVRWHRLMELRLQVEVRRWTLLRWSLELLLLRERVDHSLLRERRCDAWRDRLDRCEGSVGPLGRSRRWKCRGLGRDKLDG